MSKTALKKASYEDLYSIPDNMIGEINDIVRAEPFQEIEIPLQHLWWD